MLNLFRATCCLAMLPALWIPLAVPVSPADAAPRARSKAARKPAARPAASAGKTSIGNLPLVTVKDPAENAFTVSMPRGWRNQAYSVRVYELHRPVITSLSPDGKTLLFLGDARLPNYWLPTPQNLQMAETLPLNPLTQISPVIPAREYFPWYVRQKFGSLPGFRLTGVAANPELLAALRQDAWRNRVNPQLDAARVAFQYQDRGKLRRALVNGYTFAMGSIWIVGVSGVSTEGDPAPYNALLTRVFNSYRTDPRWKAQQQKLHDQRMAMLRQDAQNNQLAINASNRAHQMRMEAIKDAGNASMRNWYQNQAASDASHRRFLNSITGEHTVVDGSGRAFQVDNSHQRYYVNRHNNTYIGTSSTTSLNDLRAMGLNPDDYQAAAIKY